MCVCVCVCVCKGGEVAVFILVFPRINTASPLGSVDSGLEMLPEHCYIHLRGERMLKLRQTLLSAKCGVIYVGHCFFLATQFIKIAFGIKR